MHEMPPIFTHSIYPYFMALLTSFRQFFREGKLPTPSMKWKNHIFPGINYHPYNLGLLHTDLSHKPGHFSLNLHHFHCSIMQGEFLLSAHCSICNTLFNPFNHFMSWAKYYSYFIDEKPKAWKVKKLGQGHKGSTWQSWYFNSGTVSARLFSEFFLSPYNTFIYQFSQD